MNYFVQNFEIILFCNDFSCRSKVSGSLTPKSDCEFVVRGIQHIQRNNEYKGCTSNAALTFSSLKFLLTNFLVLMYLEDFEKEFL